METPKPEPPFTRRERGFAALALAFAATAFALRVIGEPFDHGYVRYLGVADEMLRSGDWVVPRLGEMIYLHKPPLFVWLVACIAAVTGTDSSLPASAPNVLGLAISVIALIRLGERMFGRREAGWLAALVFLGTFEVFAITRDRRIDPLFAGLLIGAFDAFHAASHATPGRVTRMAACGALVGLATMVKGPLALVFFFAVALPWCASTRNMRLLFGTPGAAALATLLAVASPWPLALTALLGLEETLNVLRSTALTTRQGGPLHYLLNLPGQLVPWTIFVPALLFSIVRGVRSWRDTSALRFIALWFIALFFVLHFSSAKHSRYLLPAFAPLALAFVALFLDPRTQDSARLDDDARRWRDGALAFAFRALRVAGIGAVAATPVVAWQLPQAALPVALGGALIFRGATLGREALGLAPLRAATLFGLVTLVGFGVYDAGRLAQLRAQSGLAVAREAFAPLRAGRAGVLLSTDERARIVSNVLAGRALPVATDASDALYTLRRTGAEAGFVIVRSDAAEAVVVAAAHPPLQRVEIRLDRESYTVLEFASR